MKSDTSEKGLESLIMRHMTGTDGLAPGGTEVLGEDPVHAGGTGWIAGRSSSYDRAFAIDTEQLFVVLRLDNLSVVLKDVREPPQASAHSSISSRSSIHSGLVGSLHRRCSRY